MRSIFQMFAGYNAWANGRLFAAVADLPDPEYRADHGAFFGSVHGTLNHLLVGDRIWMQRLTGEGEASTRLDASMTILARIRRMKHYFSAFQERFSYNNHDVILDRARRPWRTRRVNRVARCQARFRPPLDGSIPWLRGHVRCRIAGLPGT